MRGPAGLVAALVVGLVLGALVDLWRHDPRVAIRPLHAEEPQREPRREAPPTIVALEPPPERPRPTPPAKPPAKPPAPRPTEQAPDSVVPNAVILEHGRQWLSLVEGGFPPISARYSHLGFPGYAAAMEALGGRFFVYDGDNLRAEIDWRAGRLVAFERSSLAGLSRRSRDLTDEAALAGVVTGAARAWGPAPYQVVLLVPVWLDQALVGAIVAHVQAQGRDPREFSGFEGRYVRTPAGELVLQVLAARHTAAGTIPMNLAINLSHGARG
ncbi:MAG: hypothetical protein HY727_21615 [Candidatus Rokubacteria bacterium]|nr:hypothetical protein [Candidatus Rokubacteria bacterium]